MTAAISPTKRELSASPLVKQGGFTVTALFTESEVAAMRGEAHVQYASFGAETRLNTSAADQPERGNPPCWFESAPGGPVLHRLAHDSRMIDTIQQLTASRCEPLGAQGTYSFYRRPGHHFGVHRDIHGCDVAAITCIELAGDGSGGELIVFPRSSSKPGRPPATDHGHQRRIEVGQTVILLGAYVPHLVTPIRDSLVRVVAPLCYRILAS